MAALASSSSSSSSSPATSPTASSSRTFHLFTDYNNQIRLQDRVAVKTIGRRLEAQHPVYQNQEFKLAAKAPKSSRPTRRDWFEKAILENSRRLRGKRYVDSTTQTIQDDTSPRGKDEGVMTENIFSLETFIDDMSLAQVRILIDKLQKRESEIIAMNRTKELESEDTKEESYQDLLKKEAQLQKTHSNLIARGFLSAA